MSQIQIGCQFYTWQMSGQKYVGNLPHILKVINSAGFSGIEPETCMLGSYYENPQALQDIILQHGLKLGALTLVLDWAGSGETEVESREAERIFETIQFFPGTHLVLCQMPGKDRTDLSQRQANAIACVNAVAARAAERGITSSFHPNSPPGSVFRTRNDYRILLDGLDSQVVGFAPDSGHIVKGGMDVYEIFQSYRPLIKHVHFKDITASGEWAAMGAGMIDFPRIGTMLRDSGYDGWIMVEEESAQAETNPDLATNENGKYLHRVLLPLVRDKSVAENKTQCGDEDPYADTPYETTRYPAADQVRMTGRLSVRFQGNIRYLTHLYQEKRNWMLEPVQNRGQAWVIEPLRNQKGEQQWAGEYAGKWLEAASLAAASNHEKQLSEYSATFAADILAAQASDGYLGIEAPAMRGGASEWDLWNIRYAMTGLLTHYEVTHHKACLEAAIRSGEWLIHQYGLVTDASNPFYHSPEEGGVSANIVDELARLYRFSRQRKFLEFASSVATHFPPIIKMRETCQAPLVHAYTLLACLGAIIELMVVENSAVKLNWVEEIWEDIVDHHLYPTGSLGYKELLRMSAPNDTPVENGLPEYHHQETCATVEWILFNARLYQATGRMRYLQKMEQSIYNALLAAQSADGMSWMYYTPLRYEKRWFTGPTSCCYWSGPRAITRLPQWIYALDNQGIRINLYESSEIRFQLRGRTVTLAQFSLYPDEGRVILQVHPDRPIHFTISLRIPTGSHQALFRLNGRAMPCDPAADGYYHLPRTWSAGDQIEMEFDLPVAVEHFMDERYGILVRGVEVLSVDQRDNPALDLERIFLLEKMTLSRMSAIDGRRRYTGEVYDGCQLMQAVFTPYADCGGGAVRFRTAFPIHPELKSMAGSVA